MRVSSSFGDAAIGYLLRLGTDSEMLEARSAESAKTCIHIGAENVDRDAFWERVQTAINDCRLTVAQRIYFLNASEFHSKVI